MLHHHAGTNPATSQLNNRSLMNGLLSTIAIACFVGCTSTAEGTGPAPTATTTSASSVFSRSVTAVTVEVDYATNAAPYVGPVGRQADAWQVTADNLTRVFQSSPKTITLPHSLDQMQELTDVGPGNFTSDALLDIAAKHRDQLGTATTATYYVVFVDGYYDDGTGPQTDVLGISLGDTGVVGMFKPVITSTETNTLAIAKFVEQASVVHELGHAIGLVNNGLSMQAAHQDTAHGHHCTNEKCTMYWANEGTTSAIAFARSVSQTGSTVLYDDSCLADIDAAGAAAQ